MKLQNENQPPSVSDTSSLLLIAGIACFLFNWFDRYDRYYSGEPLTRFEIRLQHQPEKFTGGKGVSSCYKLTGTEYAAKFRVSEGAYDLIQDNAAFGSIMESLKEGDTVSIEVRKADEGSLQNPDSRLRVIGLHAKGKLLVRPSAVEQKDSDTAFINYGFSIALLLIGISSKIYLWRKNVLLESE